MEYYSWIKIACLFSIFCCPSVFAQAPVIQSVGEFANDAYEWAYGVPKIEFYGASDCTTAGCFIWFINGKAVVNVDKGFSTDSCIVSQLTGYSYDCTCNYTTSTDRMWSNIAIDNIDSSFSLSIRRTAASAGSLAQQSVTFKSCDKSSTGLPFGAVTTPNQCNYSCSAYLSCENEFQEVNVTSECTSSATWNKNISCVEETTTTAMSTDATVNVTTETTNNTISSNTTTKTGPTKVPETTTTPGSKGLSVGAIIGIVIGVLAVAAIAVIIYLYKKEKICADYVRGVASP